MQGISLNRAFIGEANSMDFCAIYRLTSNERIRGLQTRRTRMAILGRIAGKGLLVATIWLLLTPTHGLSQADARSINLLSKRNGGQVVVASSDAWLKTIDGKESEGAEVKVQVDDSAIYGFRDGRRATFDTFAVLILGKSDRNVKDFELLAGESPTGEFSSIGKFTTTNAKFYPDPYQEFKFPPVTAKYLKVHLLSNWGNWAATGWEIVIFQFRLYGQLKE